MDASVRSNTLWLATHYGEVRAWFLVCGGHKADLTHPDRIRQAYREYEITKRLPPELSDVNITEKPSVTLDQRSAEKLAKVINRANSGDEGSETAKRHVESIAKKHGVSSEELKEVVATGKRVAKVPPPCSGVVSIMNTSTAPAVVSNFNFNTSNIRVVDIGGSPWFVAIDVCKALGMEVDRRGVHSYLYNIDNSEKQIMTRQSTPALFGGVRGGGKATVISESGLYKIIMRTDRPEAKAFQDWVTKVVLPAIRKDGGYVMGEEKLTTGELSEDEFILKAMSMMQGKVERYRAERDAAVARADKLEGALQEASPKADSP